MCKLSDGKPLRHWQGAHSADINSLRWEPSGKLLASCSDDGTVKVWQATSDKPVHSLTGGSRGVGVSLEIQHLKCSLL